MGSFTTGAGLPGFPSTFLPGCRAWGPNSWPKEGPPRDFDPPPVPVYSRSQVSLNRRGMSVSESKMTLENLNRLRGQTRETPFSGVGFNRQDLPKTRMCPMACRLRGGMQWAVHNLNFQDFSPKNKSLIWWVSQKRRSGGWSAQVNSRAGSLLPQKPSAGINPKSSGGSNPDP